MKSEKTTTRSTPTRSYEDACGAAHALDLVGDRWALLVVRELLMGEKRFSHLRADLPGISANVLTQRLVELEAKGIVVRRQLPSPAQAQVYGLTPWGYESEPVFIALGRWATRSPLHNPQLPLSAVSLMLSFRTMFDAKAATGLKARLVFRFGEEAFVVTVSRGRLLAERGAARSADVTVTGSPSAVAAAVYGGVAVSTLQAQGALEIVGERPLFRRFAGLFPLPPKVSRVSA